MFYFPSGPLRVFTFLGLLAFSFIQSHSPAHAQVCGKDYAVKEDDSLSSIAAKIYGDPARWNIIFYANQDRLGANVSLLVPGLLLRVPCIGDVKNPPAPPPQAVVANSSTSSAKGNFVLSKLVKRVEYLTAEGYTPMTGRALPNGGMITDAISKAMGLIVADSKGDFGFGVSWVNDWSSHLNPLLSSRAFDAGFPWEKPNCSDLKALDPQLRYRCQNFYFSDPLYEIFEVFYVRNNSPMKFESDSEVIGKRICHTIDNGVDDLDGDGRNWVKDKKITLIRPASIEKCFELLEQQAVDAVVTPELTGKAIAANLGLKGKVKALSRPVSIDTMHVVVSRTHPQARTILYYVNTSVAKLRESGEFDKLVEKHLGHFWKTYGEKPPSSPTPPAKPSVSADKKADNVAKKAKETRKSQK